MFLLFVSIIFSLFRIREALGSNLGSDAHWYFHDFPHPPPHMPIYLKLGRDRFLSYTFQFIIH
jgi:hypothetical protein